MTKLSRNCDISAKILIYHFFELIKYGTVFEVLKAGSFLFCFSVLLLLENS